MADNGPLKWHALEITAIPEATQAVEFFFNELDSLGMETDQFGIHQNGFVTVRGYFEELPNEMIVKDQLQYALQAYGFGNAAIKVVEKRIIENADWLAEWKKYWTPTRVGRFVIAPSWEDVDEPDSIVIRIEPNMAFGTGTHETTKLCLRAIDEHFEPGMSFLDVGTGTGILAIAAAKKETSTSVPTAKFFACDTDPDAIKIAKENADLNGVGQHIEFTVDPLSTEASIFDFVCANLTLDVIVPMLPLLLEKTRQLLVLSGILLEQKEQIREGLLRLGIVDVTISRDGEWISVIINR